MSLTSCNINRHADGSISIDIGLELQACPSQRKWRSATADGIKKIVTLGPPSVVSDLCAGVSCKKYINVLSILLTINLSRFFLC